MTLQQLADNISKIDLDEIGGNVLVSKSKQFIGLIQRQIFGGKRGDGSVISPDYRNKAYAEDKPATSGRALLTPNLRKTGKWYNSLFFDINENTGQILMNSNDSDTEKVSFIFDTYDETNTLLDLSDENIEKIRPQLLEDVAKQILAKL